MTLSGFLQKRLPELLSERRIVVRYDSERALEEFVQSFSPPACTLVSASDARGWFKGALFTSPIYDRSNLPVST
jgi:hypothetical protein